MIERIIIAGGGTGGHLFPGLAVVEELRRRAGTLEVLFVGTERGIESRVLPKLGERLERISVDPLKGRTKLEVARSLARLPTAFAHALSILRRERPSLVLGVGGYASGPMLAAAASLGIPTALLEQNARLGLTNRMLAPMVGRAYLTFDETQSPFGEKARVVGNPVRRAFALAARRAAQDPQGFEARSNGVFVLGGSQGARILNQVVPEALARAGVRGTPVLHQTGEAMRAEVEAKYRELGIEATVVSFIDDIARAYASSSLVIARAGATTLAELCAIGRASVLVPFAKAADDHQGKNAEALERAGAAVCIREERATPELLGATIGTLLAETDTRAAMADAARSLGRPDAAAAIVDDLCGWLGCRGEPPATRVEVEPIDEDDDEPPPSPTGLRVPNAYVPRFGARPRRSHIPAHRRSVTSGYVV